MKYLCWLTMLVVCCAAMVASPIAAQAEPQPESKKPAEDPFWYWKKKGNWWTSKTTMSKPIQMVTYFKMEVTDVSDSEVTYTAYFYDENMKETFRNAGQKLPLAQAGEPSDKSEVEPVEEEVECNAWGKVKATKFETEVGDGKVTSWIYRAMIIKSVSAMDSFESVTELWETNIPKTASEGSVLSKPAPETGVAAKADDPNWAWKALGNTWTIKTTETRGKAEDIWFSRYTIKKVGPTSATYDKVTLDKGMKETDAQKDLSVDFADLPGSWDNLEGEEVEVECKALGKVRATKYARSADGDPVTHWVRRCVVLKSEKTTAAFRRTEELWETNLKFGGASSVPAAADIWGIYRRQGANWTLKYTTIIPGQDDIITYVKTEIVKVAEDHCIMQTSMLDKDKNPLAGLKPTETKIEFKTPEMSKSPPVKPPPQPQEKKIKVEAGEFDCVSHDGKYWMMKKYPQILVKGEVGELVEFNEGK